MNILVIHGDNIEKSYERLKMLIDEAKKKGFAIERVSTNDYLSLSERLVSRGLFEEKKLIIAENINSLKKTDLNFLKKKVSKLSVDLIIYHQGIIPRTFLTSLPKGYKEESFEIPKYIWKFLDSFYPGNSVSSLKLLHELVKSEPVEFILYLLAKQLKDLYIVNKESTALTYQGWRISKLKSQASKFTIGKIKEIIIDLSGADIKSKTSKGNLIDSLDFIISTKLE